MTTYQKPSTTVFAVASVTLLAGSDFNVNQNKADAGASFAPTRDFISDDEE